MSSWFNVKVTELQLEDVHRFVPPRVYYTIQKQIEQIAGGSKFSKVHEHDYAMPDLYIRTSLSDRTAVWKILQRWAVGRTTGWVDDIRVDFTGYGLALGHNDEEIARALRAAKQLKLWNVVQDAKTLFEQWQCFASRNHLAAQQTSLTAATLAVRPACQRPPVPLFPTTPSSVLPEAASVASSSIQPSPEAANFVLGPVSVLSEEASCDADADGDVFQPPTGDEDENPEEVSCDADAYGGVRQPPTGDEDSQIATDGDEDSQTGLIIDLEQFAGMDTQEASEFLSQEEHVITEDNGRDEAAQPQSEPQSPAETQSEPQFEVVCLIDVSDDEDLGKTNLF